MKAAVFVVCLVAVAIGLGLVVWRSGVGATEDADIEAGAALYAEHCAACHGADLEGQPNWQTPGPDGILPAPPHDATGHTWHHSDAQLFDYVKLGGEALMARAGIEFDSGMPGFGEILSDDEIRDILGFIRSTWPDDIQAAQRARNRGQAR